MGKSRMPFPCARSRCLPSTLLLLAVLVYYPGWVSTVTSCPWDETGLLLWSEASSWQNGSVPAENEQVVIPSGRRVLLDVQPVVLTSLTIESGAALIWGNVAGLTLTTQYVLVDGEFHMGSASCRLKESAAIKLTGRSNSNIFMLDEENDEIRKVILARENATLEIHGMRKTSWTRLAQTIKPISHYPCAFVYDHSDHEVNAFAKERTKGLHIIVWNEDGTLYDFTRLQVFTPLKKFITSLPNGKVIGMYAVGDGICCRNKKKADFATLEDVIVNDLGGDVITKVGKEDSYSLLTQKGNKNTTQEHHLIKGQKSKYIEQKEEYLQLPLWEKQRDFQVAKSAKTTHQFFRVLTTHVAYPILELADTVRGWLPGDKILVTSTDYDWALAETRDVIHCHGECSDSQIRVNQTFYYTHYGNFTLNVDERAEVALLSRNIVIEGVVENECYAKDKVGIKRCKRFGGDTFGGHIKVLRGHASAHVQGAELYHMGQQGVLGSYPLHFHMCDDAKGSWFRDNSIHHSFQRCITVHGTDNVEISGNVCYDHLGHGYFLEDSVEQNNVLDGNLGLGTKNGALIMSDSTKEWCKEDLPGKTDFTVNCDEVSTFWLTHPNNEVINNVAAGGMAHGFMFVYADLPLGPSYERQKILGKVKPYTARSTGIKKFYNNVAHSNKRSGVFMDSLISTGRLESEKGVPENGIIQEENYYEPKEPTGDPNGTRVWNSKLERITTYKNKQNNMWIKGGNINVTFCSLADAASQSFSGGNTGLWTGVAVEYSVFIGRSDNLGEPRFYNEELANGSVLSNQFDGSVGGSPWHTITGVGIYQGPMLVKHSYFDRFATTYWNDTWQDELGKRPVSPAGAISWKKDSTYPVYTSQYTTNLTFGYCDGYSSNSTSGFWNEKRTGHWVYFGEPGKVFDWDDLDGTKSNHNWDRDGSLTGTPNTYIVRDRPFFTGPECTYRKDWHMTMCPYRYIKFELLGKGGNLNLQNKDKWALIAYRDDASQDPVIQPGKQRREYLARTYKSYLIDFNTTMAGAAFPDEIKIQGNGVERQDVVRVGICMPLDLTDFEIRSDYPVLIRRNNYTRAKNLSELDADTDKNLVFHDTENGIIFVKIFSFHDRTNDSQLCPAGLCYNLKIILRNGNRTLRSCAGAKYSAFEDPRPTPSKVPLPTSCFGIGTPEGIGAVRWNEVPKIVHTDYTVPCITPPVDNERLDPSYVGCFVSGVHSFELSVRLQRTMTIEYCTKRCYQREYEYAGLMQSSVCLCGHSVNNSTEGTDIRSRGCSKDCSGNSDQKCGHGNRMSIWTTGLPD
ncbi:cell surface hyaluronidase-like isoform X2 [Littorina saxatilis]|uniref:cell surface hyaluronidase-like isoform X2 n=1 Tax=Littorina saxatilis TaxID=31220 RepID=UPI0038B43217